jgi:hypothetical protein
MIAYTAPALVVLARSYMAATGARATSLGLLIAKNDHLITGLLAGGDCVTESARRASDWFERNWPRDLPWPQQIHRRPPDAVQVPVRLPGGWRRPSTRAQERRAPRRQLASSNRELRVRARNVESLLQTL